MLAQTLAAQAPARHRGPVSQQAVQLTLAVPESPCWERADDHGGDVAALQLPLAMRVPEASAALRAQGDADPSSSNRDEAGMEASALQQPLAQRVPAGAAVARPQGDSDPISSTMDDAGVEMSASQLPLAIRVMPPAGRAQPRCAAAYSRAAEDVSALQLPLAMRVAPPAAGTQPQRAAARSSAADEVSASQLPLAMRVMPPAADTQPSRAAAHDIAEGAVSASQLPLAMCVVLPAAGTQPQPGVAYSTPAEQVFGTQLLLAMREQAAPPAALAQAAGTQTGGQASAACGCSSACAVPRVAQQQPRQGNWKLAPVQGAGAGRSQEFVEPAAGGDGSGSIGDRLQLSQVPLAWRVPQPQPEQAAERESPMAGQPGAPGPGRGDVGCLAAVQPVADRDPDTQPSQVPLAHRIPASPQQLDAAAAAQCAGGAGSQPLLESAACRTHSSAGDAGAGASGRDAAGPGDTLPSQVPLARRLPAPQQQACPAGYGSLERAAAAGASGADAALASGEDTMQPAQVPLARVSAAEPLLRAPGAAPGAGHGAAAVSEPDQARASFGAGHAGGAQGRPASGRAGAGRLRLGVARARRTAAPSFDLLGGILTGSLGQIRPAVSIAAAPDERQGCLVRPSAGVPAAPKQHPADGLAPCAAGRAGGDAAHGGQPVADPQGLALRTGAAGLMGPPAASPAGRTGGATQMLQARSHVPLLSPQDMACDGAGPSAALHTPMTAVGRQGMIGLGSSPSPARTGAQAAADPSGDPWSGTGWPSGDDAWGDKQWGAAAGGSGLRTGERAAGAAPAAAQRGQASTGTPLWQCGRKVQTMMMSSLSQHWYAAVAKRPESVDTYPCPAQLTDCLCIGEGRNLI